MRAAILCGMLIAAASAATFAAPEKTELISGRIDPSAPPTPGANGYITTVRTLSSNGRFVVFSSSATDLVAGQETFLANRIFVRDRQTQTTSVLLTHTQTGDVSQPSISADGRFVAFLADPVSLGQGGPGALLNQIFLLDRQTNGLQLVSAPTTGVGAGNEGCGDPLISGDGRYVIFRSLASNLVPGDTNGVEDVFEWDRVTRTTRRVNVNSRGRQSAAAGFPEGISRDGHYVLYESAARDLVSIALPGDTSHVYLYDRVTQTTELESVDSRGKPANFGGFRGDVSDDGRYVVFLSTATSLLPDNPDVNRAHVFVRDRQTGRVTLASLSSDGQVANDTSYFPAIDGAGRFVIFGSSANNLVPNDTNGSPGDVLSADIFVHDMRNGATSRASVDAGGSQIVGSRSNPVSSISADGKWVVFDSSAPNVAPGDFDAADDVFIHENRGRFIQRVNAGGQSYTDHLGREWSGDQGFVNSGGIDRWVKPIANTQDGVLYQTDRKAAATVLSFHAAVPNDGTYLVRMHFAENHISNFAAGARTFDVRINGVTVVPALDIYAAVGARAALVKESTVTVLKATGIDIQLVKKAGLPIVNAIEVIER